MRQQHHSSIGKLGRCAIILIALLPACAYQTYTPKPIDLATVTRDIGARDPFSTDFQIYLQAQGYEAAQLPPEQWGLNEFIYSALFFHPDLDVARANWRAAQAGETVAAQRPNPGISVDTEKHSEHDNGISPWTYGLAIDIPIETAGKREARIDRAVSLSEAARIEIAQTAWNVRSRVHASWLAWQHGRQLVDLLKEEHRLRSEITDMLEARFKAGMISSLELANARLQLQRNRQSLDAETARLNELKATLASDAGLTLQSLEKIELQVADLTQTNRQGQQLADHAQLLDQLRQAALLNRLDIRAALAKYDAAEARLRLEIARQYPDFVLSPGYIYDQGDKIWTFGLSTLLTLLNRNEGNIAEAEAQREVEAAKIRKLQSAIIGDLESRSAAYQEALANLTDTRRLLEAQQDRARLTARQFEQGIADRLELAGSQLETLQIKYNLLASDLRLQQANRALEDALQHPLETALAMPEDFRQQVPGESR